MYTDVTCMMLIPQRRGEETDILEESFCVPLKFLILIQNKIVFYALLLW